MKLLLIDDQVSVLLSLKGAIDPLGHKCELYNNAKEAVKRFKTEPFDAVITDIKMPKMDGIEVIKTIQKIKPGTPVIILTGYANTRNAIDAVNSGAYAYYEKPLNIKKFINMMSEIEKELIANRMVESNGSVSSENRDIIVRDMHHRIKNDLHVISKMINVQCRNINNPEVIGVLMDTKNLINSVANSHNKLTFTNGLHQINITQYFQSLIQDINSKFGIREREIQINLKINEFAIQKNYISYLGILINEIVTNSIKHAFPDSLNRKGIIRIALSEEDDNEILLTISDNGIGLPKGLNLHQSNSLGMYLIRTISEELLGGTIQIEHQKGTKFIFRLNAKPL